LELSERDLSLTEIKVQITGWKLTDYAQGYDLEFAKSAQRKGLRFAPKGRGTREVKEGESLWKIAREVYGRGSYWGEIYQQNLDLIGKNPDFILAGIQLKIPELLVPGALITDLNEPRPNNQSPAHLKAKRLSSPTLEVQNMVSEFPLAPVKIGGQTYTGKATLTCKVKFSQLGGVKNPQAINFDLYKAKLTSAFSEFGSSLSFSLDPSARPSVSVKSRLFSGQDWNVFLEAKAPAALAGSVEKSGIKFTYQGFRFELDCILEIEFTQIFSDLRTHLKIPTLDVKGILVVITVLLIFFQMTANLVAGGSLLANELNFEELKKVPGLWAKAQRSLGDFRV